MKLDTGQLSMTALPAITSQSSYPNLTRTIVLDEAVYNTLKYFPDISCNGTGNLLKVMFKKDYSVLSQFKNLIDEVFY